jgi:DNA polymerase III subunit gamma/tau
MVVKRGDGDFSQIYRPCRITEVVGNDRAKTVIERAFKQNKIPHAFLFHGVSGTGKTTIARIIELGLNCEKGPTSEPCCECTNCKYVLQRYGYAPVREINAVDTTKDKIRELLKEMRDYGYGLFGSSRRDLLLVDECHGLTEDQAGLFLNFVEDASANMYFIFCTTKPRKFLDTLKNRFIINVKFDRVPDKEILRLLTEICGQEGLVPDKKMLSKIVKEADGMPRNAVNGLQQSALAGELLEKKTVPLQAHGILTANDPDLPKVEQGSTKQIIPAKRLETQIRDSKDIGELKEIHDKAEALRLYVRKSEKGFEKQNQWAEVKIRAQRRCGEILGSEIKHGGDRKSKSRFNHRTLKDLGINKNQSRCWQILANWPARTFEKYLAEIKESNHELTAIGVYRAANGYRRARKQDLQPVAGAEMVKTPIRIRTIAGDFRNYIDKFENIDAIITDPPYAKKHLGLYEDLARFAGKVLKPGGSLLTMAIVRYLPDILDLMRPHIGYHHVISYYMPAKLQREWDQKVFIRWKAILWFVKGKYEGGWVKNVIKAGAIEKGLHPWQQTAADFEKLIEKITRPGDTVIDPLFGAGSLGEASIRLNRQFIGIEIDPKTLEAAEKRLERVAKKIVIPSFIPNANPGEVLQNWENQEDDIVDSDEMEANPTHPPEEQKVVQEKPFEVNGDLFIPTDRQGAYSVKLKSRKPDDPNEPDASDSGSVSGGLPN